MPAKPARKSETQTTLWDETSTSIERVPARAGPQRLHCGAVFTERFIQYLTEFWIANHHQNEDLVLTFEYVACIEGPRAGQSWHKLHWLPPSAANPGEQFLFDDSPCLIPRQTQKALKNKTTHYHQSQIQIT
ncbi:MAG: hypothetical protein AAF591_08445 [Verrucomicrobiota bacterium]